MAFHCGPRFGVPILDGLILALDASNTNSYAGSGNTWYDTSGKNAHGTISGSINYVNSGVQSYFDFSVASDSNYIFSTIPQNYVDFTAVIQPDYTRIGQGGLCYLIGSSTGGDASFRFGNVNGSSPWTIANPDNSDGWAGVVASTFYVNGNVSNSVSYSGWNVLGGARTNTIKFPFSTNSFNYYLGTGYPSRAFQGKIAAIYMYNRVLKPYEHLANHNTMKARFNIP